MSYPELKVDIGKIVHNSIQLQEYCARRSIDICLVTKLLAGNLPVLHAIAEQTSITSAADSRIANIARYREEGLFRDYLLTRIPMISEAEDVVRYCDVSLNSEIQTLKAIDKECRRQGKRHGAILMVDVGDRREGVLPSKLEELVRATLLLDNVDFRGIGTNLACYGGVIPTDTNMRLLSQLCNTTEHMFHTPIEIVSGGNSANLAWLMEAEDTYRINHLRLGEAVFLGRETVKRNPVEGLYQDAFTLNAEIVELKTKSSLPYGEQGQDAFGNYPEFKDEGDITRAILAIGRQDTDPDGLMPKDLACSILGASSDHLIVHVPRGRYSIGDVLSFDCSYGAVLALMTSQYVKKTEVFTPVRKPAKRGQLYICEDYAIQNAAV